MQITCTFAGNPLARVPERRDDPDWLEQRLRSAETRFLPLWRLKPLIRLDASAGLAWARFELLQSAAAGTQPVLLGVVGDVPHFAVDVSGLEKPEAQLNVRGAAEFQEARAAASRLTPDEAGILAAARAVVGWHQTHRFCCGCGHATSIRQAGWVRFCDRCNREHFPRTDPVVIAAVTRGDRCLLGRQPGWPATVYSALAGFVEPGESIEEAVRREVREESGVRVGRVRYHASQPWPFPHSLMVGCMAEAETEEIHLHDRELADARWFGRDELRAALAAQSTTSGPRVSGANRSVTLPGPVAIAHHLIAAFVAEG